VTADDVERLDRCLAAGGVALFPADTVYGLAADAESSSAVERLYRLKGRSANQPAAVMFFSLARALDAVPELGPRTRAAAERLLPGGVTLVVANPRRRYPLACGPAPERLGLRVPALAGALEPLRAVSRPVLQSSANPAGAPPPRRLDEVDPQLRAGVDAEVDGGELPGTASTVVDLTGYEDRGAYEVLRDGAVSQARLQEVL
jgi:L-threonylcarbamoyladenylate synthase